MKETREQGVGRRELKPVQWTEHTIGSGDVYPSHDWTLLGSDYESALSEIIEQEIQKLHDQSTEKNQHLLEFLKVESLMRASYWRALLTAQTFLTKYRREHDMRPFNWALEYRETVISILGLKSGQPRTAQTIEQRQLNAYRKAFAAAKKGDDILTVVKDQNLDELRRCTNLKPEHQGANHPLELNQIIRRNKPCSKSSAQ